MLYSYCSVFIVTYGGVSVSVLFLDDVYFMCWCDCWIDLSVFFFKQKTAYEMRISDWSSDVCSSDLTIRARSGPFDMDPAAKDRIESIGDIDLDSIKRDRKSVVEGKSVSVRVDLGGRRIIKKKIQILVNNVTSQL